MEEDKRCHTFVHARRTHTRNDAARSDSAHRVSGRRSSSRTSPYASESSLENCWCDQPTAAQQSTHTAPEASLDPAVDRRQARRAAMDAREDGHGADAAVRALAEASRDDEWATDGMDSLKPWSTSHRPQPQVRRPP